MELAANDGSLIREMQAVGLDCVGMDPAANIVEKAQREVEGVQDESRNVYPIDAANVANSANDSVGEEKPAAKPVARSGRAARIVE